MQTLAPLTVESLAAQPWAGEPWELIDGEIVPTHPAGSYHSDLVWCLLTRLTPFVVAKGRTWRAVADNAGFVVSRDPDEILSPDVAIYKVRPRHSGPWFNFSPELAIEIASPDQAPQALLLKKQKYLAAGTEQVWIVDPRSETITIYLPDGTRMVHHDEPLAGFGLLDGFSMHVGELFADSPYREKQG